MKKTKRDRRQRWSGLFSLGLIGWSKSLFFRRKPSFDGLRPSGWRAYSSLAIVMVVIATLMATTSLLLLGGDSHAAGISRIQNTTGGNGSATTITATLGSTPINGNSLIAVVGTRGTTANQVSSITQTGATWVKAISKANATGSTTDIWYALNVSSASTSITVNLAATLKASVVISEYSNIAAASAVDQSTSNSGTGTAITTGTTATTTVADELWIGGVDVVNTATFTSPVNSFTLVNSSQSTGGSSATRETSGMLEKIVSATGTAATGATSSVSGAWSSAIVTFKPSSEFGMAGYRLFANQDSADVGSSLAAQDTGTTLTSTGQAFRLRLQLKVTLANLALNGQTFKLQFRAAGGACDDTGSWSDVTTSTLIAYNNNATPADAAALTANASDPVVSGSTTRNQTYEELNNFTNSQLAIALGENGKWDFSLKDNGAVADTTYCIRAATSGGATLTNNTVFPAVTTKGPDAILKQEQFDNVRSLLATNASTTDGVSTSLYFDQYMRSSSSSDVLTPTLEIRSLGTSFTNAATHTGNSVIYDPALPDDTRYSCSAYDSGNQQMVTWGGFSGTTSKANHNDTWVMTAKQGERSQWKLLTTTGTRPQANRAHMCVFDSLNQRLIVFGGWNGTTYLTNAWALTLPTNGSTPTWSALSTAGTLPNTDGKAILGMLVYDPSPSRMILYGGFTGSTDNPPNTYQLTLPSSGTPTWSDLGLTTGASASGAQRDSSTLVYDAQADRAIMFGGIKGTSTYLNEVWSLNLAAGSEAWTQITPSGTPPTARENHFAAWQPDYTGSDDRMIVFAGENNGTLFNDVWELDFPNGGGTPTWVARTPGSSTSMRPFARGFGATPGVYDPLNKRALFPFGNNLPGTLYENNTIAFDLNTTGANLPIFQLNDVRGLRAKEGAVMAYNPDSQQVVMHAGTGRGAGPSYSYDSAETWKMDVNTTPAWVDVNSDLAPTKREFGAMQYDTINDRFVYCLGYNNVDVYPNDCWQLSNPSSGKGQWTWLETTGTAPVGRYALSSVYDSANNRMVFFGGDDTASTAYNDVYFLTFSSGGAAAWSTPTTTGTAPSARWGSHTIYDPVHQKMILFGGVTHAGSTQNDEWELTLPSSGTLTWRAMSPTGTPPAARRGGTAVYDPDRGDGTPRMVVFGGFGSTHYNDLYELTIPSSGDGTWTTLSPSGTPPSTRRSQAGTYDPVNDRMIIYGGRDSAGTFVNDTFSVSLGASPAWTNLTPQYYIPGTVKVTSLTNNTAYHWQGWADGSVSGTSQRYSYGGNAESSADFTIGSVGGNTAPNSPTSLVQNKVTGGASVSTGGWTGENQIRLSASATDPDTSDTLQLCVEKQLIGVSFTGSGEVCGTGVAYSGSSVTATVDLTSLSDGEYHWQARLKDAGGLYSSWVSYGGNAESARDFGVDTIVPTGTLYDGSTAGVDAAFNSGSLTSLDANWTDSGTGSPIIFYQLGVGTTPGATDVRSLQSISPPTSSNTFSSLSLVTSQTYYFTLKIYDSASNLTTINSNGIMVAPTLTFSTSSNTVAFNPLNASNSYTNSQTLTLTTTTNAQNGYQVYGKATGLPTSQSAQTLAMFSGGTYASPAAWGSNNGFGYNSSDTLVGGTNRFNSASCLGGGSAPCYAPYSLIGIGDVVADASAPTTSGTNVTITNKVSVNSSTQRAGRYQTTVLYSAYATY